MAVARTKAAEKGHQSVVLKEATVDQHLATLSAHMKDAAQAFHSADGLDNRLVEHKGCLLELHVAGATVQNVAAKTGVTRQVVSMVRRWVVSTGVETDQNLA